MQTASLKTIPVAALLASVVSLMAALVAQFVFGLVPCHLCQWQRVPYVVVILLSFFSMMHPTRMRLLAVSVLIGLTFLSGAGLAGYHAAVEKHLVAGPTGCTSTGGAAGESIEDFEKRITHAPIVSCDMPQFEVFGVTMAGMNAAWSLALALTTFIVLARVGRTGARPAR